jgi:predicted ATPase with chaperone activity
MGHHELIAQGLDERTVGILQRADKGMTMAKRTKVLRVARTIADLEGTATIEATHAAGALNLAALA